MLKIAVCVSGGGTNLQAIIDGIEQKTITNTEIAVVISNNPGAYALERAKKHGIEAVCISPKEYESRAAFNEDFLRRLDAYEVDLVVLAGFLVVIILQKAVEVQEGDTPEILQRRVMEQAEWKIMPQAIDLIANGKVTVTGKTVHISK